MFRGHEETSETNNCSIHIAEPALWLFPYKHNTSHALHVHVWNWEQSCYKLKYLHVLSRGTLPADGFISGTMTGAPLCSFGVVRDKLVEDEEGEEEEGTPEDSLSPLFMARTEWLTLASRLLGFGNEFSERRKKTNCDANDPEFSHNTIAQMCQHWHCYSSCIDAKRTQKTIDVSEWMKREKSMSSTFDQWLSVCTPTCRTCWCKLKSAPALPLTF